MKCKVSVIFFTLAVVLSMGLTTASGNAANVQWKLVKTLDLPDTPMDMALTPDGGQLFVLTDKGDILVYSQTPEPIHKINVGKGFDQMRMGPRGNTLILSSKTGKHIKIISLDIVQDIRTEGSPFKGPADASVVIALFTDFECPYCAKIGPVLDQILEKYPRDVKIVFKNYPLRSHKFAMKAAQAAMAAGKKGKFWECHDLLFKNYNALNDETLRQIIGELALDQTEFEKNMKDPSIQNQIRQDMLDGQQAGVKGTPTVFVNGIATRNLSFQGIDMAISGELKKTGKSEGNPVP